MNTLIPTIKQLTTYLLAVILLLALPLHSFAKAGCCSKHGGIASCNKTTGLYQCKDGSNAHESCKCEKSNDRGCCSRHGGVAKCDTKSGQLKCKDGTSAGANCTCDKS